jgi:hypothetical protein
VRPLPKSSALLGLPHLCSHYGSRPLFYLYEAGVLVYLVFTLWGLCATFTGQASATVMALFLGEDCSIYNEKTSSAAACQYAYYGSLSALTVAGVTWVVSGSPVSERVSNGAAVFKVVGCLLMIFTASMALVLGEGAESSERSVSRSIDRVAPIGALGMWPSDGHVLKGVSMALVYAVLAYNISFDMAEVFSPEQWQWWAGTGNCSHNHPRHASTKPATRAAVLVTAMIVVTLCFYIVIGIVCAALFGPRAASLINLHWRQYEGVDFLSTSASPLTSSVISLYTYIPLWARLLQILILIFPIVSAITSLAYLANTQSESLIRLISYDTQHPHSTFILHRTSPPKLSGGRKSIALLAILPPLVLTAVVGDLGSIFLMTAPLALFIQYVLPAILLLLTRYGPNAEAQHGDGGQSDHQERPRWYLKPSLLFALLAITSVISIITLTLLGLYPLW